MVITVGEKDIDWEHVWEPPEGDKQVQCPDHDGGYRMHAVMCRVVCWRFMHFTVCRLYLH